MTVALDAMNRRVSQLPNLTLDSTPKRDSSQTALDNKANENLADDKKSYLSPDDRNKSRSKSPSPVQTSRPSSVIITATNPTPPQTLNEDSGSPTQEEPPEFEVDDEFNLPISVAVVLLLLYMMIGAAVFTIWEDWSFFEACFRILLTVKQNNVFVERREKS